FLRFAAPGRAFAARLQACDLDDHAGRAAAALRTRRRGLGPRSGLTATTAENQASGSPTDGGPTRAIVLVPVVRAAPAVRARERAPEARLEEAVGLAAAINLEVADAATVPLGQLRPATLFG